MTTNNISMKKPAISSHSQPRYHPINNPPYQIHFKSKGSGKHIAVTKQQITFQFGFSSSEAISSGLQGARCRGEEHEVVLIWSHITGKRQVMMDEKEIHSSKSSGYCGKVKFQHSWVIQGNHILQLIVNAAPRIGERTKMSPEFRQFDLLLDGMSYFDLPNIYELGIDHKEGVMGEKSDHFFSNNFIHYQNKEEQNDDIQTQLLIGDSPTNQIDLLQNEPISDGIFNAESTAKYLGPADILISNKYPQTASGYADANPFDSFVNSNSNRDLRQSSFDSISDAIMGAYKIKSSSDMSYDGSDNSFTNDGNYSSMQERNNSYSPLVSRNCSSPTSVMISGNYSPHTIPDAAERNKQRDIDIPQIEKDVDVDELTKSVQQLVNLDDITCKPFSLSKNPFEYVSKGQLQGKKTKPSQGLPSKSETMNWSLNGRAPTLAEIQAANQESSYRRPSNEKMPSALVAYGAPTRGNLSPALGCY